MFACLSKPEWMQKYFYVERYHDFYHVEPQSRCLFDDDAKPTVDLLLRCAPVLATGSDSLLLLWGWVITNDRRTVPLANTLI